MRGRKSKRKTEKARGRNFKNRKSIKAFLLMVKCVEFYIPNRGYLTLKAAVSERC